jgi:hypothetical protein
VIKLVFVIISFSHKIGGGAIPGVMELKLGIRVRMTIQGGSGVLTWILFYFNARLQPFLTVSL